MNYNLLVVQKCSVVHWK